MGTGAGAGAGSGATGAGAGVGTGSGGCGTSGSVGSGTGCAGVGSASATGCRVRGPGVGLRACIESGNWVVARSGTLGSTRLLNTPSASLARSGRFDGALIERLDAALRPGLIGCAYWYTT